MVVVADVRAIRWQGIRFIRKDESRLMRVLAALLGIVGIRFEQFWTTIRLPFGEPTIYYPAGVLDPLGPRYDGVRAHELEHVEQQRTWYGLLWSYFAYLLVPLPVGFSGRWFIERNPFLGDIRRGMKSVDQVVELLWRSYLFPWPRFLMRRWFLKKLCD